MRSFSATAGASLGPAATSSRGAAKVRAPRRAARLRAVYGHRIAGPGHHHDRNVGLLGLGCLVVCLGRRRGVFGLLCVRRQRQSECKGGNQAGDTDRKELVCTRHSLISLRKGRALSARPPTSTAAGGRPLLLRSATRERVRTRRQRCKWRATWNRKRPFFMDAGEQPGYASEHPFVAGRSLPRRAATRDRLAHHVRHTDGPRRERAKHAARSACEGDCPLGVQRRKLPTPSREQLRWKLVPRREGTPCRGAGRAVAAILLTASGPGPRALRRRARR